MPVPGRPAETPTIGNDATPLGAVMRSVSSEPDIAGHRTSMVAPASMPMSVVQRWASPQVASTAQASGNASPIAPDAGRDAGASGAADVFDGAEWPGSIQREDDGSFTFATPEPAGGSDDGHADIQRVPAAGGAPSSGAAVNGNAQDLDELARRLYSRMRVHLRHELRMDRERSGSLLEVDR